MKFPEYEKLSETELIDLGRELGRSLTARQAYEYILRKRQDGSVAAMFEERRKVERT